MNLILSYFLDDTRAHVGISEVVITRACWSLPLTILELGDLLINANLFAHDALNINLVRLVIVFD